MEDSVDLQAGNNTQWSTLANGPDASRDIHAVCPEVLLESNHLLGIG